MLDFSISIKGQRSHADDMQQYYSSVNGKGLKTKDHLTRQSAEAERKFSCGRCKA